MLLSSVFVFFFFFFNDTATTEIYTLSLHDALPICLLERLAVQRFGQAALGFGALDALAHQRSEEHTSELQSPCNLVCRLLLEKKKKLKCLIVCVTVSIHTHYNNEVSSTIYAVELAS